MAPCVLQICIKVANWHCNTEMDEIGACNTCTLIILNNEKGLLKKESTMRAVCLM